jgi:hypothetical protein
MKNIAHVAGGKPIGLIEVYLRCKVLLILSYGRKGERLFFYFVPDTTRESLYLFEKTASKSIK